MLRTLAINSNKKCVKFWCFDSFLITKANLKLRRVIWNPCKEYTRTVRPDTPSEGIQTTYPGRNYTRLQPICTRLPPICTRMCATILHPDALHHFAPGCRPLSTRMFMSGIQEPNGRGGVSTSPDGHIRII